MRGGKDVDRDDWYWRVFEEVPDVNLVSVTECAWDLHHDVVAVIRA
jgi:hypothetical protein